ncbi:MAG: energy transducer TonB [Pseudomonadota bacterium]
MPAPPAPMPPPPAPSPFAKQPVARAPESWVTNDYYPPAALRAHQAGMTRFRLEIDAAGRVSDCILTGSSGWPVLDATTCALLKRRARFVPAEDHAGAKVASSWSSRFRWELPDRPVPLASWAGVARFRVDADGRVSGCRSELLGTPPDHVDPCDWPATIAPELRDAGKAVLVEARQVHAVDGSPIASAAPPGSRVRFERETHFLVRADGEVEGCRVDALAGADWLYMTRYDCHPGYRYTGVEGAGRSVRVTLSITTRPGQ